MGRVLRIVFMISCGIILYGYFGYDELSELIGIALAVGSFVALGSLDEEKR